MGKTKIKISERLLVHLLHLEDVFIQDAKFKINQDGVAIVELTIKGRGVPNRDESLAVYTREPEKITVKYEPIT
jgi:hypothetical protein